MTTIYAVSAGEYSAYGICAIFSTRENAEKYMVALPREGCGGYNEIEEYELDQYMTEIDRGLQHYRVIMYRSGNVHSIERSEYVANDSTAVHWMDRAYWNPPEPWANFYVWAEGSQAAIKIANERRVQALATITVG